MKRGRISFHAGADLVRAVFSKRCESTQWKDFIDNKLVTLKQKLRAVEGIFNSLRCVERQTTCVPAREVDRMTADGRRRRFRRGAPRDRE